MFSNNLKCSLGCSENGDQRHIFEKCDFIFKDKEKQKQAKYSFNITEEKKKKNPERKRTSLVNIY